jgi:beta-glucosidase-like glycosyl hydrolase
LSWRTRVRAHGARSFINNEQEHARTWSSSAVDARTERELYAHPFLRMAMAGAASVMCSYNLINGSYACENDGTLGALLKQEIGFRGCACTCMWG